MQRDSYKVYAWLAESPNHVTPPRPLLPGDGRDTVTQAAADPTASPFGWHDLNGAMGADTVSTTGSNVFTQTDLDNNNAFTPDTDVQPLSCGSGMANGGSPMPIVTSVAIVQPEKPSVPSAHYTLVQRSARALARWRARRGRVLRMEPPRPATASMTAAALPSTRCSRPPAAGGSPRHPGGGRFQFCWPTDGTSFTDIPGALSQGPSEIQGGQEFPFGAGGLSGTFSIRVKDTAGGSVLDKLFVDFVVIMTDL